MSPNDSIDPIAEPPTGPIRNRWRTAAFAAAALGVGALAAGGIASARSSGSAPDTSPNPPVADLAPPIEPVVDPAPVDVARPAEVASVDADPETDELEDDSGTSDVEGKDVDTESDEREDDVEGEESEESEDFVVSEADEAVFAQFDRCLADAGFDEAALDQLEQSELDGTIDQTALESQWEALDAAEVGCEPILAGLSPELQAFLESEDAEECEHDDGDGEAARDDESGSAADTD